jgi:hypothetical protein
MPKWYEPASDNIIGIPLDEHTPKWLCSSPPPDRQLRDLARIAKDGLGDNKDYSPLIDHFTDYNKDPELAKILSGKRIAFVGPAPSLSGQKTGSKIDSYDLVIRINTAYDMPEYLWEDYGARTDLLVSCLNMPKIAGLSDNLKFVESLKYLIQANLSMWDIHAVTRTVEAWPVPFHNVCDGYIFKIDAQVGTVCNTGLIGAITLLNYDIQELYITGFNFFDMGENLGAPYNDAHLKQSLKYDPVEFEDNKLSSKTLRFDIHNQEEQIYYFGKILEYHNSVVTLDPYLQDNFNMWISGALKDKSRKEIQSIFKLDRLLRKKFNLTVASNTKAGENK